MSSFTISLALLGLVISTPANAVEHMAAEGLRVGIPRSTCNGWSQVAMGFANEAVKMGVPVEELIHNSYKRPHPMVMRLSQIASSAIIRAMNSSDEASLPPDLDTMLHEACYASSALT